jgi:amino acid transporter
MGVWSLANLLRIDHQAYIHTIGAAFQVLCTLTILTTLTLTCDTAGNLATPAEVFTGTYNGTGFESFIYVAFIGTLSALYSFTGYEAAGQMAEETYDAVLSSK